MAIDLTQLTTPTPEVMMEMRSCLNCLHRLGNNPSYWRCAALGGEWTEHAVKWSGCTIRHVLWAPRPVSLRPWWRFW